MARRSELEELQLEDLRFDVEAENREAAVALDTCRVCGCTDAEACPGGCIWAEPDLCSRCAR